MLEDRDYMRQPSFHAPRLSFTIVLLIINTIIFLIQLTANHSVRGREIEWNYFALSLAGIKHGYVWQLLTFQFMHANWLHLIFNSIAIFFFGRQIETIFGSARFLTLYFASGIIGGLVQMLFALVFPSFDGAVVGASAGGYGLVAAFAVMNWMERFTLFIYFIPVTMRGRTLLWVILALAIGGMLLGNTGVANAAHLGGILTGFVFARRILHGSWPGPNINFHWPQWKFPSRRQPAAKPETESSADEFVQNEVDPILEKISAHGIQSLTKRERDILEKARTKMSKR
ncbi:MAG TPA: rhomboid family intramembrane serine protease [Verrucomicrobiae bacterium]|nr:rhomboid family intramembrane serine protease [Verrucomicrobiae bacterium]